MHLIRDFRISVGVATIVVLALNPISTAAIFNASVSETASATAKDSPVSPLSSDSHSNALLPPSDVGAIAVTGSANASSEVTISSYIGPVDAAGVSASLTIQGNTTATTTASTGAIATAAASLSYTFSLDDTESYTFGRSDISVTLIGPGGPVAQGPGTLSPGTYVLSVASNTTNSSDTETSSFSVHVAPEPTSLALAGLGAVTLLRRRRVIS